MDTAKTHLARTGALTWVVGAAQLLIVQLVAQSRWHTSYTWSGNNISDLGSTTCGVQDPSRPRYVCSPAHDLMNVSFVLYGVLLLAGVLLTGTACWGRGVVARAAGTLTAACAAGWVLVGLYPADVDEDAHLLGALLIMGVGNLGLLCAVLAPRDGARGGLLGTRRALTLSAALTATAGTALFFAQRDPLGLGLGLLERFAGYGTVVWTCALGAALLRAGGLGPPVRRTRPCGAR